MELTKRCKGCRCSRCRWQGTDNCPFKYCCECDGRKENVTTYMGKTYLCRYYDKKAVTA